MGVMIYKNGKFSNPVSGSQMNGEKIPGDLASWSTYTTDSNLIVQSTYEELSKRGMTLFHTSSPASAAITKNRDYAIGSGLQFRSHPDKDILGISSKKLKKWSMKFQKLLHYYFLDVNFYAKQPIIFSTAMAMGDSLLFFVRENGANGKFDLVETGGDQIDWSVDNAETTLGIIHDDLLRGKGIVKTDGKPVLFQDENGDQNVLQFYFKDLARQLRGLPLTYKVINLMKNHDRFMDATVQRAVLESIMFASSKTDTSDVQAQASAMAKANRAMKFTSGETTTPNLFQRIGNVLGLGGGNIFQLKSQENLEFTDLKTPSNNFDKFNDAIYELCGMATDTPPEVLKGMYSTSYTAHKGALNDFIKAYMLKRKCFEQNVGYPVIREVAKYFILNGLIEAPGFFESSLMQRAWLAGNWLGPVPGAINPAQEVNAQIKSVEAAFQSRSDIAALYGNEYNNYMDSWQEEEERFYEASPEKKAELVVETETTLNGEKK